MNEQTNPWPEWMQQELYSHRFSFHFRLKLVNLIYHFTLLLKDKGNVTVLQQSKNMVNNNR